MNYHETAFTNDVLRAQKDQGSRQQYAQVFDRMERPGFSSRELDFIRQRDSFYMATVGTNGFPYIQHRGGPIGFLHALDEQTLGFVDFSGNRQYITLGNLASNNRVSLFLMDYPNRARMKIYARARVVEIEEDPELFATIDPAGYDHTPERMIVFNVEGFDWNCPQHITPKRL